MRVHSFFFISPMSAATGSWFRAFVRSPLVTHPKISLCTSQRGSTAVKNAHTRAMQSGSTDASGASSGAISADSKCQACKGLTETMNPDDVERQRTILIPAWQTSDDGRQLFRSFKLKNFASALRYVNLIGDIAEAEGHHPDLTIRSYNHVDIALSTHSVGGITENDLIMAVKIDTVPLPIEKRSAPHAAKE